MRPDASKFFRLVLFYNLKKEDIKNMAVFPSNILFSCFVVQLYYTWQLLPLTTEDGSFCPCQLRTLRVLNNGGRKKIKQYIAVKKWEISSIGGGTEGGIRSARSHSVGKGSYLYKQTVCLRQRGSYIIHDFPHTHRHFEGQQNSSRVHMDPLTAKLTAGSLSGSRML